MHSSFWQRKRCQQTLFYMDALIGRLGMWRCNLAMLTWQRNQIRKSGIRPGTVEKSFKVWRCIANHCKSSSCMMFASYPTIILFRGNDLQLCKLSCSFVSIWLCFLIFDWNVFALWLEDKLRKSLGKEVFLWSSGSSASLREGCSKQSLEARHGTSQLFQWYPVLLVPLQNI